MRSKDNSVDYISGVMSLRDPQKESLKILAEITEELLPERIKDLESSEEFIKSKIEIFKESERSFLSITFALATGVGKTRLIGAFIAYLYTHFKISNFFIVAPNTTVYDKLRKDLSDINSPKYVFKGLDCFKARPYVITEVDYSEKSISLNSNEVRIFLYNIDKFNKDSVRMKKPTEMLGESFYDYLSKLPNLVLIMDESHHYHAKKSAKALEELNPILGIELTATPLINKGSKQIRFKNIVLDYPLANAIEDGYTRTPFAVTKRNFDKTKFSPEEIDRIKIQDGLRVHERIKEHIKAYSLLSNTQQVKPFMMITCKDTDHAKEIENFVKSDVFGDGKYRNKVLQINSKQSKVESQTNTRFLLEIEDPANPVEIVIHVDMLKEGWDVNNLYTIVPLRAYASEILREQTVGRGLRLPYGKRTGNREVDSLMIIAHDNFDELIAEAQKGDSLFNKKNVVYLDDESVEFSEPKRTIHKETPKRINKALKAQNPKINVPEKKVSKIIENTASVFSEKYAENKTPPKRVEVKKQITNSDTFKELKKDFNKKTATEIVDIIVDTTLDEIEKNYIPIPIIKETVLESGNYNYLDFELDLNLFRYRPKNEELVLQDLTNNKGMLQKLEMEASQDLPVVENSVRDIVRVIREEYSSIDYAKASKILIPKINQIRENLKQHYLENVVDVILEENKKDIASKLVKLITLNAYREPTKVKKEIIGTTSSNHSQRYSFSFKSNLFDSGIERGKVRKTLFSGIEKNIFDTVKFDSFPEYKFAKVLEKNSDVLTWFRPTSTEMNLKFENSYYEPDFIVEAEDANYIIEIKGMNMLDNEEVLKKKEKAIEYCRFVNSDSYLKEHNLKEWHYLFIPEDDIKENRFFEDYTIHYRED